MAIAFDNAAVNASSDPVSFTCTGANRILFLVSDGLATAVTYGGVGMTLAQSLVLVGGSGAPHSPLKLWWLMAPASGANNIAMTSTGTKSWVAASYTGAQQTGSLDAIITNVSSTSATSLATSLTTVADNDWIVVVEWGYAFGVQPTAGANLTLRGAVSANGSPALFDSNAAKTPAGSFSGTTNIPFSAGESIFHIMVAFTPPTSTTITGTGDVTFAAAALASAGTVTLSGTGAVTWGGAALASAGTETITGTGAETFAVAALAAAGTASLTSAGAVVWAAPGLDGTGTLSLTGTGNVTWGGPALGSGGGQTVTGTGEVTWGGTTLAGGAAPITLVGTFNSWPTTCATWNAEELTLLTYNGRCC